MVPCSQLSLLTTEDLMKHQQAPKWLSRRSRALLSTAALLAVLGANYSFQTNSLSLNENNGFFELSSSEVSNGREASRGSKPATKSEAAPAPTKAATPPPPAPVESEQTQELPKAESAPKQQVHIKREGKVVASGTCADDSCKNVLLSMETLEKFVDVLEKATSSSSKPMQKNEAEESDDDCDFSNDDMSARAKQRERTKCLKERKDREKREELVSKFEDKMEDIKDKCEVVTSESKLECVTREFNHALSRYSGRNSISPAVAQRYFKQIVGSELAKSLFNSDKSPEDMMSTLQDIFDGLPTEFSGLRKSVLDAIQNQTRAKAAVIHQQFKSAETLKNNPEAYLQTVGEAQQQQAELSQMAEVYSAAARTSDSFSTDSSFTSYYQANYLPSMRKIFSSINGTTGVDGARESIENRTRSQTRGSSMLNSDLSAPSASKIGDSTSQWQFPNGSSGLNMGAPSNTSRGNTRGARSMGM